MIPELEKPRITEVQVRMDCNGCVQKIKKALSGINDPEKIVKAVKKTRKSATICTHTEPADQPTEAAPPAETPPDPDAGNPPPAEAPPAEAAPPADPPKDQPPLDNPPSEVTPSPVATDTIADQTPPSKPNNVEQVHVIYHGAPEYGYRYDYGQYYPNGPGVRFEPPQPVYVTHSYNKYKPSTYVTEYEHIQSPPTYIHHSRVDHYSEDHYHNNNVNGNFSAMFSDENPNACRIV
ncbi:proline-rich receptor-like protein kinase PERK10 isoform X2 [Malania oleifera]|uniref:proline-rich receptor-like protein kinase PERK10 isoform X2 n=1 Tax=Malania oleifera TaxID=397392 RepID=UPI0025AE7843|nr:proline-rich receptor-like protein kinase PERK10 isoform X2 [Malania oleifera]